MKPAPFVECSVCGREFGSKSIIIHERQCLQKLRRTEIPTTSSTSPNYTTSFSNNSQSQSQDTINKIKKNVTRNNHQNNISSKSSTTTASDKNDVLISPFGRIITTTTTSTTKPTNDDDGESDNEHGTRTMMMMMDSTRQQRKAGKHGRKNDNNERPSTVTLSRPKILNLDFIQYDMSLTRIDNSVESGSGSGLIAQRQSQSSGISSVQQQQQQLLSPIKIVHKSGSDSNLKGIGTSSNNRRQGQQRQSDKTKVGDSGSLFSTFSNMLGSSSSSSSTNNIDDIVRDPFKKSSILHRSPTTTTPSTRSIIDNSFLQQQSQYNSTTTTATPAQTPYFHNSTTTTTTEPLAPLLLSIPIPPSNCCAIVITDNKSSGICTESSPSPLLKVDKDKEIKNENIDDDGRLINLPKIINNLHHQHHHSRRARTKRDNRFHSTTTTKNFINNYTYNDVTVSEQPSPEAEPEPTTSSSSQQKDQQKFNFNTNIHYNDNDESNLANKYYSSQLNNNNDNKQTEAETETRQKYSTIIKQCQSSKDKSCSTIINFLSDDSDATTIPTQQESPQQYSTNNNTKEGTTTKLPPIINNIRKISTKQQERHEEDEFKTRINKTTTFLEFINQSTRTMDNNNDEFTVLKASPSPSTRLPGVILGNDDDDDDGLELEYRTSSKFSASNLVLPINCSRKETWRDLARDKLLFRSSHSSMILPGIFTWKKGDKTSLKLGDDDIVDNSGANPILVALEQKSGLDLESSSNDTVQDGRSGNSSNTTISSVSANAGDIEDEDETTSNNSNDNNNETNGDDEMMTFPTIDPNNKIHVLVKNSAPILFQSMSGPALGQSLLLNNNPAPLPHSEETLPRLDQKILKPHPKHNSDEDDDVENASVLGNSAQTPLQDRNLDELAVDDVALASLLDVNFPFMSGNPTSNNNNINPDFGSFPSSFTSFYSSAPSSSLASSTSGASQINHVPNSSPDSTEIVLLDELTTLITEKLKKDKHPTRKRSKLLPYHNNNNNTSSKSKSKKIKSTNSKQNPFEKVNDWLISSQQSPREPGVGIQRSESETMVLGQDVRQSVFIGDGVIFNTTDDASSSPVDHDSIHLSNDSVVSSLSEPISATLARPSTAPLDLEYYHSFKANNKSACDGGGGGNSKQITASPVQIATCSKATRPTTTALTSTLSSNKTQRKKKSRVTKKHDRLNPVVSQSDDNPNKVIDGHLTAVFRIQQIPHDKQHVYKFIDHMTLNCCDNKEDENGHEVEQKQQQPCSRPTTAPQSGHGPQHYYNYNNQQFRPNTSTPLHSSIKNTLDLNKFPMEKKKKTFTIQPQQPSPKNSDSISAEALQKPPWGFSALKKSTTNKNKAMGTVKKRPLTPIVKPKQGIMTPYLKTTPAATVVVASKKKQVVDKSCQHPEKVSVCTQCSSTNIAVTSAHKEVEKEADITDTDGADNSKTDQVLFERRSPKLQLNQTQDVVVKKSNLKSQIPKNQSPSKFGVVQFKDLQQENSTATPVDKTKESLNLNLNNYQEMNLKTTEADVASHNIKFATTRIGGLTKTESDSHAVYKFTTKEMMPLIEFDKIGHQNHSHVPIAYTLLLPRIHEEGGEDKGKGSGSAATATACDNDDDGLDLTVIVRRENDAGQLPDVETVIPCFLHDWMYLIIDETPANDKDIFSQSQSPPPQKSFLFNSTLC